MLPGYPAGVAATSPPYPTGVVAIHPGLPGRRSQSQPAVEGPDTGHIVLAGCVRMALKGMRIVTQSNVSRRYSEGGIEQAKRTHL